MEAVLSYEACFHDFFFFFLNRIHNAPIFYFFLQNTLDAPQLSNWNKN